MLKKGFTIVELAIVLIIIGIIIGMAVKGGALLQTAKMRAEFRKVDKIRTALSTWRANNPIGISKYPLLNPGVPNSPELDMYHLVTLTYLTEQEINNPFKQWELIRGGLPASGITDIADGEFGKSFILRLQGSSPQYACNFEVLLDDRTFDTGSTRIAGVTATLDPDGDWFECVNWPTAVSAGSFLYYDVL
jgi:prepilin-type N-terminal cleavage/methylation domain-containing protein